MITVKKGLLILVTIIVVFFGWRVVVYFFDIGKTAVQEELALESVSGDNYTFYYPKGWVSGDNLSVEAAYYAVNNQGERTGEGISLEIVELSGQTEPATEELCQELAQSLTTNPSIPGKVVSVAVSSTHPAYEGCKVVVQLDINGLTTYSEVKGIWHKDRGNNMMYISRGDYAMSTPEELKAVIKDSVGQFSID